MSPAKECVKSSPRPCRTSKVAFPSPTEPSRKSTSRRVGLIWSLSLRYLGRYRAHIKLLMLPGLPLVPRLWPCLGGVWSHLETRGCPRAHLESGRQVCSGRFLLRRAIKCCFREAAKWVAQVRDRIEQYEQGSPQYRLGLWRRAFDTAEYQKVFEPPQERTWSAPLSASLDIVVDRACTKSYMAILPNDE